MPGVVHIYEWCRRRKYFGRTRNPMSHLLLDKGILSVPDSAHDDFIHEYSTGVLKGGQPPCIVEYKLPVFRMFYDLDIVAANAAQAKKMSAGDFDNDVKTAIQTICLATVFSFDVAKCSVIVCISNVPKKTKDGGVKVGIHLTFENMFANTQTSLHVREKVLEHLNAKVVNPFSNPWEQIIDVAVFKGSGMRLPWSAKQDDQRRVYIPRLEYMFDSELEDVVETIIDPDEIVKSLSSVKDIITKTCLRSRGVMTRLRDSSVDIESISSSPSHHGNFTHASLSEFSCVIDELSKVLPSCYVGRFTGVVKTEHAYMFRHSSKYCENVKRNHTSSNTYFMVSRHGMRQCCYSRKEDDGNRCPCENFRGDHIELPSSVMTELFPEDPPKPMLPPKPIEDVAETLSMKSMMSASARRKMSAVAKKKPSTSKAAYHRGSALRDIFGSS